MKCMITDTRILHLNPYFFTSDKDNVSESFPSPNFLSKIKFLVLYLCYLKSVCSMMNGNCAWCNIFIV